MYDSMLEELDAAFKMVSSVPVTHDAIDVMAAARSKLRKVYAELQQMKREEDVNGDGSRASTDSSGGSSEV